MSDYYRYLFDCGMLCLLERKGFGVVNTTSWRGFPFLGVLFGDDKLFKAVISYLTEKQVCEKFGR
jgi:hypothetical protein